MLGLVFAVLFVGVLHAEVFSGKVLRLVGIGCSLQMLQQLVGMRLV